MFTCLFGVLLSSATAGASPLAARPVSFELASDALLDWAGDAPIVARVTAVRVETEQVGPGRLQSEVLLRVDEVLRVEEGGLKEGEFIEMTLPGGELETWGQLTSDAPVFLEGVEGVVALAPRSDGLWPAHGNKSFLPLEDDALRFCAAPNAEAAERCMANDAWILPVEGVPLVGFAVSPQTVRARDLGLVGF